VKVGIIAGFEKESRILLVFSKKKMAAFRPKQSPKKIPNFTVIAVHHCIISITGRV
jgi:hypothetical protein